jgi:hypothetical protein
MESLLSIRSTNCVHTVAPASYGLPPSTNERFSAMFPAIHSQLKDYHIDLVKGSEPIIDVEKRTVSMHLKGSAVSKLGPYNNEYIMTITVTEDGEKVERILEFLDSGYTRDYFAKLGLGHSVSTSSSPNNTCEPCEQGLEMSDLAMQVESFP